MTESKTAVPTLPLRNAAQVQRRLPGLAATQGSQGQGAVKPTEAEPGPSTKYNVRVIWLSSKVESSENSERTATRSWR